VTLSCLRSFGVHANLILIVLWCTIVLHWLTSTEEDDTPLGSGMGPSGYQPRSKYRSHRPQHSAIASYARPRSSSEVDINPTGIRREIHIEQAVETMELAETGDQKTVVRISAEEI
jgi:hypothetical protein